MSSVGIKIKDVLEKVGTAFNIFRSGESDVAGGYLDYEINHRATSPFYREHAIDATLAYDTDVVAGDVIRFSDDNSPFLTVVKTPIRFKGITENQGLLLKCNVSGEIWRSSGEVWDANYLKSQDWQTVRVNAFGVLTNELSGANLDEESPAGLVEENNLLLYVPSSYGIKPLDRYVVASGEVSTEYYMVKSILPNRYESIDVCKVSEDTRDYP